MQIRYFYSQRVIRIMTGVGMRHSCKGLFKKLDILPVPYQYLFSLLTFDDFLTNTNTDDHGINTRAKHQLHRPTVTLSCIKKGVWYSGIKIFNRLPPHILKLKNKPSKFRVALRKYLITHSVYSVDNFVSSSQSDLPLQHQQL
jgi:hypothetical protein